MSESVDPNRPKLGYFLLTAAILAVFWAGGVVIEDNVHSLRTLGVVIALVFGLATLWTLWRTYRIFRGRRSR